MREILFRGKGQYNDWVYGYLCRYRGDSIADNGGDLLDDSDYYIRDWTEKIDTGFYGCNYKVFPSTVGQYTGLTDKNGKKIFEGDIVKVTGLYPDRDGEKRIWKQFRVGEVFYYRGAFYFGEWQLCNSSEKCIEIIGNIHDNPELLEDDK